MNISELREFERKGEYVFHGTHGVVPGEFEPRQAYTIRDGERVPDGESAVYASSLLDYAIFMSVMNRENCPLGFSSGFGIRNGVPQYRASAATLSQLSNRSSGHVYVFNRADFALKEVGGAEWIAHVKVLPICAGEVFWEDFEGPVDVQ